MINRRDFTKKLFAGTALEVSLPVWKRSVQPDIRRLKTEGKDPEKPRVGGPAYTFTGDTDTGYYFPEPGKIAFVVNGKRT